MPTKIEEITGLFCDDCGEECEVTVIDVGIGPYEFWGATCCDSRSAPVSCCCEATVYRRKLTDSDGTVAYMDQVFDWGGSYVDYD